MSVLRALGGSGTGLLHPSPWRAYSVATGLCDYVRVIYLYQMEVRSAL